MASKDKKTAKMGHNKKKKVDPAETAASKLVIVAGTHRVSKNVTGKTDCGLRLNEADRGGAPGWRYGTKEDVACTFCLEGSTFKTVEIEVPPTFPEEWSETGFEVDGHHANDADDIPVLCFECGENWPCPTVILTLPKLDLDEFDDTVSRV